MLTYTSKNDIINSLVGEADFLCKARPRVCVEKLTVSPTNRRNGAFLLEGNMKTDRREYHKKYMAKFMPWEKTFMGIKSRCGSNLYFGRYKNIKNCITVGELKYLWFRDEAQLMKKPTIDRIDSSKDYTFNNCRYIELSLNSALKSTNKINFAIAQKIRCMLKQGFAQKYIANIYSINQSTVSDIKLNKWYKPSTYNLTKGD